MGKVKNKFIVLVLLLLSLWQLSLLAIKFRPLIFDPKIDNSIIAPVEVSKTEDIPKEEVKAVAIEDISLIPEKISISKINLSLPIVSVPMKNGTWEVKPGVANYAEGTSLINEKSGNVGLYGHARSQEFLNIKKLVKGDGIILTSGIYQATYEVTKSTVVSPTMVNVFYFTEKPTLTLITCDGYTSEKRYVVTANLLEISKQKNI